MKVELSLVSYSPFEELYIFIHSRRKFGQHIPVMILFKFWTKEINISDVHEYGEANSIQNTDHIIV